MSFFKNDYSLNYSNSQHPDSSESEVDYLKLKLIETHSKLIRELQYSKELEQAAKEWQHRYDSTMSENESLVKKMNTLVTKAEKDRFNIEKVKQMELNLVESQKKNELLRIDLQSMRTKILELITAKQSAEDDRRQQEQALSKLGERLTQTTREVKQRQTLIQEIKQEAQRFRSKYQKQVSINKEIQEEVIDMRSQNSQLARKIEDMEGMIKQEKDKHGKNMNELLLLQKEAKEWRTKAEGLSGEVAQLKEENYMMKTRNKQDERNLASDLEKLTNDYNNLQSMYRLKENQLESARRKPLEDVSRKKNKLEQTKELVGKLQKQEQLKMAARGSPSPRGKAKLSPKGFSRSYKEEKEQYLSMIESVGSMESQMLACNVERKKILSEIDKIDQTRIKTKDMIARRRRLQVELQNQQKKLQHIRNELKKMKVM